MTREQIEELEADMKRAEGAGAEDPGAAYWRLADAVPRLLEERRRLLALCKLARDPRQLTEMAKQAGGLEAFAADAIAFAEAPAD